MFHQACTAETTGDAAFLDLIMAKQVKMIWGLLLKSSQNPQRKEGSLLTGNNTTKKTTLNSISFRGGNFYVEKQGEAIRLRHLKQKKEDYLSSFNRLK